jgi:hypothetical protein
MTKPKPDLGETCPKGDQSGRIWKPPVSLEQARARVLAQMRHLEESCRIGLDVGYAIQCYDEAADDFRELAVTGTIDVEYTAARIKKLAGECAALEAEATVLEAQRRIIDGEA